MYKPMIFLLLLISAGIAQANSAFSDMTIVPEAERKAAPDFLSENLAGGNAGLTDYKGKLILLNFWATWCMPCRVEMPGMERLWQKYKEKDFVIVAISNDDESSRSRIETFQKKLDLSFPILLDPESEINDQYKVSSMPTSFLIDANGKVISRIVGSEEWSSPDAIQFVEGLLSQ